MKTHFMKLLVVGLAMMAPVLTSCQSAATRFFTLYPVAPRSTPRPYQGPEVRVDAVHIPPSLDRMEIVGDVAAGELEISDLEHWSASLGQMARQTLSADLAARMPAGRLIFPHLPKPEGAMGISVDVLNFNAAHDDADLDASWVFTSADSARTCGGGTASLQTHRSTVGAAAIVRGWSALLAQLADRIVATLAELPPC